MPKKKRQASTGNVPEKKRQTDIGIMRNLVDQEIQRCESGLVKEIRDPRGMWYESFKPLLSARGVLNNLTAGGKPKQWDALLSDEISARVHGLELTYAALNLQDKSRRRWVADDIEHPVVSAASVRGRFPWVILMTEKDTRYHLAQQVASIYGCSVISGGGEPSFCATENQVRAICETQAFIDAEPSYIFLLAITDYDPYGFKIFNAQTTQITDAIKGLPCEMRLNLRGVEPVRIGIVPAQLGTERLQESAYEPKPEGLKEWLKETGGINGEPLGLEMDALTANETLSIFIEALEMNGLIDYTALNQDIRDYLFRRAIIDQFLGEDFEDRISAQVEKYAGISLDFSVRDYCRAMALRQLGGYDPANVLKNIFGQVKQKIRAA